MASILGRFTKTDVERKQYTVDYSSWLGENEVLIGVVTLIDLMNADEVTDTTPLLVEAAVLSSDLASVTIIVDNGTIDGVYVITLLASTTITQLKEDGIQITVTSGVVE